MQDGDYAGALPLLERAVAALSGTGSLTEAYASYNLAFTRFALGRCDGVLSLLERSEAVQGERERSTLFGKSGRTAAGRRGKKDERGKGKGRGKGNDDSRRLRARSLRELREDLAVLGEAPLVLLGEDQRPSATTSNCDLPSGVAVARTSVFDSISAARLAARVS